MRLVGPAEAETNAQRLTAGEITLRLDSAFRAEKLIAAAGSGGKEPQLSWQGARGAADLSADTLTAEFAPAGWITKAAAAGSVRGTRQIAAEREELSAENAVLDVWPKVTQPKELNLSGAVLLKTTAAGTADTRALETNALRMEFNIGQEDQESKLQKAETLAPGTLEWTDAGAMAGAAAGTKLSADKLQMEFQGGRKARQLQAAGNVRAERAVPGRPAQTATANTGAADLPLNGGWTQIDLQGDVKLKEAGRSGQADRAVFRRAEQTAVLIGKAVARDETTETHAARITFTQTTGDVRADGGVQSTDFSARGSTVHLAPAPANITSDTMQANSNTGRALYGGHARLWQGDSVLEADSIELLRDARVLNAAGNVRSVFLQAAPQGTAQLVAVQTPGRKQNLWHATSGTLTYRDAENRAHLEKNVVVQSADQRMRSAALDLYFIGATAAPAANVTNTAVASRQIARAVGTGGVIVEQGARKATAERGEYTALDGKFVMSGGNPALYDANEGTTTGRQLTFFLADDTIIVDSENGSRTLTRHRVEK